MFVGIHISFVLLTIGIRIGPCVSINKGSASIALVSVQVLLWFQCKYCFGFSACAALCADYSDTFCIVSIDWIQMEMYSSDRPV